MRSFGLTEALVVVPAHPSPPLDALIQRIQPPNEHLDVQLDLVALLAVECQVPAQSVTLRLEGIKAAGDTNAIQRDVRSCVRATCDCMRRQGRWVIFHRRNAASVAACNAMQVLESCKTGRMPNAWMCDVCVDNVLHELHGDMETCRHKKITSPDSSCASSTDR